MSFLETYASGKADSGHSETPEYNVITMELIGKLKPQTPRETNKIAEWVKKDGDSASSKVIEYKKRLIGMRKQTAQLS